MIDTAVHIRQNGFSIQWYSPSFGGGLPAYPNPQHLEYSAVQLAMLVMNPWLSILMVTIAAMAAGFACCERFLRSHLGLAPFAAALGAVFFVGNGFYFEHMIVGHLGFQLFPLGTLLLLLLVNQTRPWPTNAAMVALTTAAMVFHSGFHLIILLALSILMTLTLMEATGWIRIDLKRVALSAVAGMIVAIAISAPKLYAVLSLMRQFPRETVDVYDAGLLQALTGFVAQFGLAMTATPLMWLARSDLSQVSAALMRLTGASPRMGIWEVDTGISPVLVLALIAAAATTVTSLRTAAVFRDRRQIVAALMMVVLTWVAVEMTLARGFVYPLIQSLPVMRSLHVTVRFAAVFLLPMAIIGASMFDRWLRNGLRSSLAWAALVVAVMAPASYLLLPARSHFRTFDVTGSVETDRRVRSGEVLPVTRIADVDDADALATGASSMRPYEPLFGYALETFQPQIALGSVSEVRDGRFNMTNPSSLVFPELNQSQPFERISAVDSAALDAFTHRRPTPWRIPPSHGYLVWLSLVATAAALGLALMGLVRR